MISESSVEISHDLRRLFWRTRKNRWRFPPKGLTQQQVAARIGKSPVWYRRIENGGARSAGLATICDIAQALDIDQDVLEVLGYHDVAEELQARAVSPDVPKTQSINHSNNRSGKEDLNGKLIVDFRHVSKLTKDERKALLIILRKLRGAAISGFSPQVP